MSWRDSFALAPILSIFPKDAPREVGSCAPQWIQHPWTWYAFPLGSANVMQLLAPSGPNPGIKRAKFPPSAGILMSSDFDHSQQGSDALLQGGLIIFSLLALVHKVAFPYSAWATQMSFFLFYPPQQDEALLTELSPTNFSPKMEQPFSNCQKQQPV